MRIRTCVTYRCLSQLLAPFSDESGVAPHVVRMQLAIEAHVVSARSVLCFLQRIGTTEVIRVLGPPLLIEPVLLFLATLGRATSLLALFESRMWMKPAPTVRTPSPREHGFPLQATSQAKKRNRGARKREKQKGKALLKPIRRRRKENQKAKEHGSNFGRLIRDQGVGGSNPLAPTTYPATFMQLQSFPNRAQIRVSVHSVQ